MEIFVGMSGGVDSSTSAALLKEQGHDVTGVFIKVWHPDFLECTWEADRRDAMRVCTHLGIPFKTYDFEDIYKREIVDSMVESYKRGETPNPDVLCNRHIKFGAFFKQAREEGAEYVATGHYARVEKNTEGVYELKKSKDLNKDQTYFLWQLTQEELAHTMFPVGGFEKSETRDHAAEYHLPVAQKKDSQGLCFIGKLDMKDFLKHFVDASAGKVLDLEGNEIGEHDGALFYTLGQRHGFRVRARSPEAAALYVIGKDMDANTITVASDPLEDQSVDHSSITIDNQNWISHTPHVGERFEARLRYRQELFTVEVVYIDNMSATFSLNTPQPFIPKGQSLVLYAGDVCIGGGIIAE